MTAEAARKALADAVRNATTGLDNFVVRGAALAEAEVSRFDLVADMAAGVFDDGGCPEFRGTSVAAR